MHTFVHTSDTLEKNCHKIFFLDEKNGHILRVLVSDNVFVMSLYLDEPLR